MTSSTLQISIKTIIVFFFLTLSSSTSLLAQYERLTLFHEITPDFVSADSTLKLLNKHLQNAEIRMDTALIIKCLVSMGSVYRYNLDFEKSFESSGEAVYMSEEFNNVHLKAKAHEEFGLLSLNFFQDEGGMEHFKKSLEYYILAYKMNKIEMSDLFYPYFNLYRQKWRIGERDRGRVYLDSSRHIFKNTDIDKINKVYLNFADAEYLYFEQKYTEAQKLLLEAKVRLENLPKKPAGVHHKNFLSIIYNGLARIESTQGNIKGAISYLEKALSDEIVSNEFIFFQSFARSNYANLLAETGDYENAYKQNLISSQILDNYLNPRKIKSQGFLSVVNPYQEELRKKDIELSQQKIELAEQKQEVFRIRIFLVILIGFIIVTGIILWARVQQIKHRKKMQMSKELLDHKNKELTANMLQLIEKEDIIHNLADYLRQPEKGNASLSYLKNLEKNSGNLWEEFNSRFVELNGDFYENLQKRVPNLTPLELKISALLKLNFSGKEMAYLLGMSLNSVNVARSRLRKKLDLDRETNLTGFINSI